MRWGFRWRETARQGGEEKQAEKEERCEVPGEEDCRPNMGRGGGEE